MARLHPYASNILEFRYHHISQLLARFRLFVCFRNQDSSVGDIPTLVQSAVNVVTLSLQYGATENESRTGGAIKYSWLYGCKFPFEYGVECVFKACLFFHEQGFPHVGLTELRKRILCEQSRYLPITSQALRWLESGSNKVG